jgi:integrase
MKGRTSQIYCKSLIKWRARKDCSRPAAANPSLRSGPSPLRAVFNTGQTAAALPLPVRPHMFRHARGYKLANDEYDTRALQHYLGRKNITRTLRLGRRESTNRRNAPTSRCKSRSTAAGQNLQPTPANNSS